MATPQPDAPPGAVPPDADNHSAHHLHEFGDIDNVVHVAAAAHDAHEHDDPVSPVKVKTKLARRHRWSRLKATLLQERHLMQYFYSDTLYRARELRKVSREELFLDLVIVAAIAALGHELRAAPITWAGVEKFMLLFAAVYSAWRQVVILWNWWGVKEDLYEKAGIYVSFVSITGIALGAHEAFNDGVRPYVAISAFIATFVPAVGSSILASWEPLLKHSGNRVNQVYIFSLCALTGVLPYFAAAFVQTRDATRLLYWIAFGMQLLVIFIPYYIYKLIHRDAKSFTRMAVNIELMVEKFEVLTMIVLGESVIGILFEAGAVVSKEGARIGLMYLSAIGSTVILYALQTYYIQIDNPVLKGGTHAIRHRAKAGMLWSTAHMLYHMCLILFATGVGFGLRDIVVPPKAKDAAKLLVDVAVRAGGEGSTIGKEEQFTRAARWVYTVGWGGSLLFSGTFSALHHGGVRAATKRLRLGMRAAVVIALMVGMPFASLSAGSFQAVFVATTAVMSFAEFLLVYMDRIGFFRSENSSAATSTAPSAAGLKSSDDGELFLTDGASDDDDEEPAAPPPDLEAGTSDPAANADSNDRIAQQLRARLCKGHCTRMEIVRPKGAKRRAAAAQASDAAAASGNAGAASGEGQEASLD